MKTVVFLCAYGKNYGNGHFSRSITLAAYLRQLGIKSLFLSSDSGERPESNNPEIEAEFINHGELADIEELQCIIVDKRESGVELIKSLKKFAPVIVLDSNGRETEHADIIIDALPVPGKFKKSCVNIEPFECCVLNSVKRKEEMNISIKRGAAYFGNSLECAELAMRVCGKLNDIIFTFYVNDISKYSNAVFPNITFKNTGQHFSEELPDYDIFLSYFGLSALEAVQSGTPTILLSPTKYHEELAQNTSDMFISLGYYKDTDERKAVEAIANFINDPAKMQDKLNYAKRINPQNALNNFADIIKNADSLKEKECRCCATKLNEIIQRTPYSNVYKCPSCAALNRIRFRSFRLNYEENYFGEEYKKQYGKSYEDDDMNIRRLARKRLKILRQYKSSGKLLDLGAALGFFIDEAEKAGYSARGIELSEYAVNFAQEKLEANIFNIDIDAFLPESKSFDIISAWYFLEHCDDLDKILNIIHSALKDGGILSFAMPNAAGISARALKGGYAKRMPEDHFFEATPKGFDSLLKSRGFVRLQVEGGRNHFDRFCDYNKTFSFLRSFAPAETLYNFIADKLLLSDTFEGYYKKV